MANNINWSEYSAYNGDKPFIFISYSHKDFNAVAPVIKALQNRGYRVWLDLGIEAGTEWANNIAEHLGKCAAFIVFISKSSMASEHCLDEIAYAKSNQKPSLMVFIEDDVEIPVGTEMQTARFQRMYKSRHSSEELFVDKICEASFLDVCKGEVPEKKAVSKNSKKNYVPVIAASVAMALAVVAIGCVMAFGGGEKPAETIAETTEAIVTTEAVTTQPEKEELTLSDNLFDFTVKLDGVVYKFPCDYDTLVSNGWTISTNGYSPTTKAAGLSDCYYYMANSGKKIEVNAFNFSGNAEEIQNCEILGAEWYFDEVDFELPGGITADSSAEDVINAYGTPHEFAERDDYDKLVYRLNNSDDNFIKFNIYKGENHYDYSTISISNLVLSGMKPTETNPERPEYLDGYVAPTSLGDDILSGIVRVSGDLYRVPTTVETFLNNGWVFYNKPGYVVSGGSESIVLARGDEKLALTIKNYAEYQTVPENCIVPSIHIYNSDNIALELPGGITFDSTHEAVKAECEGFEFYDYATTCNYNYYDYNNSRQFTVAIGVDKEKNRVGTINVYEQNWIYE